MRAAATRRARPRGGSGPNRAWNAGGRARCPGGQRRRQHPRPAPPRRLSAHAVIYALREPSILLGLLLGFLIGVPLRAGLQRQLTRPGGLRRRGRLSSVGGHARPALGWPGYLDPYGAVAALLSGAGWGPRIEAKRTRATDTLMLVTALAVHGALAAVGLAAYAAAGGS